MNRDTLTTPYLNFLNLRTQTGRFETRLPAFTSSRFGPVASPARAAPSPNLEGAAYISEYSAICTRYNEAGLRPVEFLKWRLGKQNYCLTGEFRYWVWEREAPDLLGTTVGWRAYVSNKKGISFEVDAEASPFQAKQAWFHFLELLGIPPRALPHMEVFEEATRLHVESVAKGSYYLSRVEALKVVDDGDPEGGVLANVTYRISERRDAEPEKIREWVTRHLEARMPWWSKIGGRSYKIEFEGTNFDGTDLANVAFYYPCPRINPTNYMGLAYRVWSGLGRDDYSDEVLSIRERGRYLETERRSNLNPTTMAPLFEGGLGEPIRHHGEHIYITKQLLKLAEGPFPTQEATA